MKILLHIMKQYTLIELETYQAVVEAGSFHLAADRLSTSAATVSRRINSLESALGVRLLNRTTRNINMTEAGEQYLDDVKNILTSVECSEERIREGKVDAKGELRIAAPLSFGLKHLSPILPLFMKSHPNIHINLKLEDSQTDLQAEGIDIALRIGSNIKDSSLIATPLCSIPIVICVSPEYLNKHDKPKTIDDIQKYNFLGYSLASNNLQIRLGLNFEPQIGFVANNGDVIKEAAINGFGITALPLFMIEDDLKNGKLVTILDDHEVEPETLYMVRLSRRFTPSKVTAMVDYLKQNFQN